MTIIVMKTRKKLFTFKKLKKITISQSITSKNSFIAHSHPCSFPITRHCVLLPRPLQPPPQSRTVSIVGHERGVQTTVLICPIRLFKPAFHYALLHTPSFSLLLPVHNGRRRSVLSLALRRSLSGAACTRRLVPLFITNPQRHGSSSTLASVRQMGTVAPPFDMLPETPDCFITRLQRCNI